MGIQSKIELIFEIMEKNPTWTPDQVLFMAGQIEAIQVLDSREQQ